MIEMAAVVGVAAAALGMVLTPGTMLGAIAVLLATDHARPTPA